MAARVMLLILVVGVFIALWAGDRHSDCECKPAHTEQPVEAPKPKHHTHQFGLDEDVLSAAIDAAEVGANLAETDTLTSLETEIPTIWNIIFDWCERHAAGPEKRAVAVATTIATPVMKLDRIPLPGGITPGDYRIVCSDGNVCRMQITEDELRRRDMPVDASPKSFYHLHDGRCRWYYIRMETENVQLTNNDDKRSPVIAAKPAVVAPKPRPNGFPPGWWSQPLPTQPLSTARQWIADGAVRTQDGIAAATTTILRGWQEMTSASMQALRQAAGMPPRLSAEPGSTRR